MPSRRPKKPEDRSLHDILKKSAEVIARGDALVRKMKDLEALLEQNRAEFERLKDVIRHRRDQA